MLATSVIIITLLRQPDSAMGGFASRVHLARVTLLQVRHESLVFMRKYKHQLTHSELIASFVTH